MRTGLSPHTPRRWLLTSTYRPPTPPRNLTSQSRGVLSRRSPFAAVASKRWGFLHLQSSLSRTPALGFHRPSGQRLLPGPVTGLPGAVPDTRAPASWDRGLGAQCVAGSRLRGFQHAHPTGKPSLRLPRTAARGSCRAAALGASCPRADANGMVFSVHGLSPFEGTAPAPPLMSTRWRQGS